MTELTNNHNKDEEQKNPFLCAAIEEEEAEKQPL